MNATLPPALPEDGPRASSATAPTDATRSVLSVGVSRGGAVDLHSDLAPFCRHLGVVAHAPNHLELDLAPHLANRVGAAHGGVIMTLLDAAMGGAARMDLAQGYACVTIEMKTTFFAAAEGRVQAKGKVIYRTPTMVFAEADVLAADGTLCARASATFKPLRVVL